MVYQADSHSKPISSMEYEGKTIPIFRANVQWTSVDDKESTDESLRAKNTKLRHLCVICIADEIWQQYNPSPETKLAPTNRIAIAVHISASDISTGEQQLARSELVEILHSLSKSRMNVRVQDASSTIDFIGGCIIIISP